MPASFPTQRYFWFLGEFLVPTLFLNGLCIVSRYVPSVKRLREPGRKPFFKVGGKAGAELVFHCYIVPLTTVFNRMLLVHAYLAAGAFTMSALESNREEAEHAAFIARMNSYKARVPADIYAHLVDELGDPNAAAWRNWDFAGAWYYCITLISTIGYGSFGPSTDGGMLFTAIYTIIGIPVFLSALSKGGAALPQLLYGPVLEWLRRFLHARLNLFFAPHLQAGATRVVAGDLKLFIRKETHLQRHLRFMRPMVDAFIDHADDGDGCISVGELQKVIGLIVETMCTQFSFGCMVEVFFVFVIVIPLSTSLHFLRPLATGNLSALAWTPTQSLHWSAMHTCTCTR